MHRLCRISAIASTVVLSLAMVMLTPAAAAPPSSQPSFFVLSPIALDVAPSITHHRSDRAGETKREKPLLVPGGNSKRPKPGSGGADGALQTSATTPLGTTTGLSFDGVGIGLGGYADCCAPPDTNASVGTTQVVEWVNLDYAVFDKATGALLAGPTPGNTLWSGVGAGACGTNNDGDPIVKFDAQARRWFMTQLSVSGGAPYYECIAISSGDDFLTSSWARYVYSFGSSFPDYPKVGVWPDAYYMSFNLFANGISFSGGAACAFDRAAMLAGVSATAQCFNLGTGVASLLPADLDGATGASGTTAAPATGAAEVFANFGSNAVRLWKFHADFANPGLTTVTGPASLAVPSFSTACNGGTCVPQAGTTNQLDSLGDRLMYRLAYRNFGDHESLIATHSVKGGGTAAPRWYELRSAGDGVFSVAQASSYAPDATYRWMASAAMDKQGNLAVGYSASSAGMNPAIRYTGRGVGDPASQLRAEATIVAGTGSQTGSLHRWGDYSSMALDPSDDCTFWYANEYLKANGSFNWSTHLASFRFATCQ